MDVLIGIGAILAWLISDIWPGIKVKKSRNMALKALLISVNVVLVFFIVLLLNT